MAYKPKIVAGRVHDTGYPIDGYDLYLSMWKYDNHEKWHLYSWDDDVDEAVMLTIYNAEREAGFHTWTLDTFTEMWKRKQWYPMGSFCLDLDKVEVIYVLQEEEPK